MDELSTLVVTYHHRGMHHTLTVPIKESISRRLANENDKQAWKRLAHEVREHLAKDDTCSVTLASSIVLSNLRVVQVDEENVDLGFHHRRQPALQR